MQNLMNLQAKSLDKIDQYVLSSSLSEEEQQTVWMMIYYSLYKKNFEQKEIDRFIANYESDNTILKKMLDKLYQAQKGFDEKKSISEVEASLLASNASIKPSGGVKDKISSWIKKIFTT